MTDSPAWANAEHGTPLGLARRGFSGRIQSIQVGDGTHGLSAAELERRLLELGIVEGAEIEILHEGPLGRDPIALRVNDATIALRRREAMAILVSLRTDPDEHHD
jgi:ferrous iron transport protein A